MRRLDSDTLAQEQHRPVRRLLAGFAGVVAALALLSYCNAQPLRLDNLPPDASTVNLIRSLSPCPDGVTDVDPVGEFTSVAAWVPVTRVVEPGWLGPMPSEIDHSGDEPSLLEVGSRLGGASDRFWTHLAGNHLMAELNHQVRTGIEWAIGHGGEVWMGLGDHDRGGFLLHPQFPLFVLAVLPDGRAVALGECDHTALIEPLADRYEDPDAVVAGAIGKTGEAIRQHLRDST